MYIFITSSISHIHQTTIHHRKMGYLIVSIIGLKLVEIMLNHVWVIYLLRFETEYAKDLQLGYFNRIVKMKSFKLNKLHNEYLKKQIDMIAEEAEQFLEYIFETVNGFGISVIIFLIQVIQQDVKMLFSNVNGYCYI